MIIMEFKKYILKHSPGVGTSCVVGDLIYFCEILKMFYFIIRRYIYLNLDQITQFYTLGLIINYVTRFKKLNKT